MTDDVARICGLFDVPGKLAGVNPFGEGHIHDTFVGVFKDKGATHRILIQCVNTDVFENPRAVVHNIQRVTEHIRRKLVESGAGDVERRSMTIVPTRDGSAFVQEDDGTCWRAYRFIEGTRTLQTVDSPESAYRAARAFGLFQSQLADLPKPRLIETIPRFHNTRRRMAALEVAIESAPAERAERAAGEIRFALDHREHATAFEAVRSRERIPQRVTHNDTKLNNVLFDEATGEAICVVDLDTVMPGMSLHDLGDMVRSMTCEAAEDEPDLSRVTICPALFDAVVRGYLEHASDMLLPAEKEHLLTAARAIIFEQGIRFLADYLSGDTYYRIDRPEHNIERTRTQFELLRSTLQLDDELQTIVKKHLPA